MQIKKALADKVFNRAAHDHARSGIGEFNDAILVEAVDALADGIENPGLITLEFAVPGLQFTLKANHLGMGFHPRNHFLGLKRLGNVIRAAKRKTFYLGLQIIQCRQKHHRTVGRLRVGFQALANLIAVHFRHHDIQKDDFRVVSVGKVQCFLTFVGDQQTVAFVFQGLVEDLQVLRVVVHQQNRHLGVLTDSFSHRNTAG